MDTNKQQQHDNVLLLEPDTTPPSYLPPFHPNERNWHYLERVRSLIQHSGHIPKIIYQTDKTRILREQWAESPSSWRKHHPEHLYVYQTDEDNRDYIREKHPYFLQQFDDYVYPIQRADAVRYFLLLDYGGIYSDLDMAPRRTVTDYFKGGEDIYLVFSPNGPCFSNFFMASAPAMPLWNKVIHRLMHPKIPWFALTKHPYVLYSTGPAMFHRVVMEYDKPIGFLPRSVFAPISLDHNIDEVDQDDEKSVAAMRVLEGQSWNSLDSSLINFVFRNRWLVGTMIVFAIIMLILMVLRYRRRYLVSKKIMGAQGLTIPPSVQQSCASSKNTSSSSSSTYYESNNNVSSSSSHGRRHHRHHDRPETHRHKTAIKRRKTRG
jgi:mannosyltransferase OCH1-like enzyme